MPECKHGLKSGQCAPCKATNEPDVYVSRGGDVYHANPRCSAFLMGHRFAASRLGNVYDIERTTKLHALGMGRRACDVCVYTRMVRKSA